MRFADILRIALSALYQQKVRTALTTLGVICAAFVLVVALSVGQGVQHTIVREFTRYDQLRKIDVHPGLGGQEADIPKETLQVQGDMDDDKRERLRQAVVQRWPEKHGQVPQSLLTQARLQELENIDHVEAVVPSIQMYGWASLGGKAEATGILGAAPDNKHFRGRVVAGEFFASPDEPCAVVSEYLLYLWGVADDAGVSRVLGQKLRLQFHHFWTETGFRLMLIKPGFKPLTLEEEKLLAKINTQLPGAFDKLDLALAEREHLRNLLKITAVGEKPNDRQPIEAEFTITGVFRSSTKDDQLAPWDRPSDDIDIVLPLKTAEALYFKIPEHRQQGFDRVTVIVDREENVREVVRQINGRGLHTFSLIEFIDQQRFTYLLIFSGMTFIAGVAFLVAALGITNTMLMSVLERTREVGVMKAVGARDQHIQLIFLVEGALIGAVGGSVGLLLSWLASFPGDAWVRSMVTKELKITLEESLFVFPLWLTLGAPLFATLVTTLAAVYPARRAARVNPIAALRHE